MPNSRQSSAIDSPPSRRATNCSLSSMTEHSFQGVQPSPKKGKSVTYVSGTICYLCVGSLTKHLADFGRLGFGAPPDTQDHSGSGFYTIAVPLLQWKRRGGRVIRPDHRLGCVSTNSHRTLCEKIAERTFLIFSLDPSRRSISQ